MNVLIYGTGQVGAQCAYALLHSQYGINIWLSDRDKEKMDGIVEDLSDAAAILYKNIHAYDHVLERGFFDAIIITAGRSQLPGQCRHELFAENYTIVKSILTELRDGYGYTGLVLMVTNPVDRLTLEMKAFFPEMEIRSSGIILDTVRLSRIKNEPGIKLTGSHDDGLCVLRDGTPDIELTKQVTQIPYNIIRTTGATKFGIAEVVREIIEKEVRKR